MTTVLVVDHDHDIQPLLRLVDTAASLDAAGRQAFRADLLGEPRG